MFESLSNYLHCSHLELLALWQELQLLETTLAQTALKAPEDFSKQLSFFKEINAKLKMEKKSLGPATFYFEFCKGCDDALSEAELVDYYPLLFLEIESEKRRFFRYCDERGKIAFLSALPRPGDSPLIKRLLFERELENFEPLKKAQVPHLLKVLYLDLESFSKQVFVEAFPENLRIWRQKKQSLSDREFLEIAQSLLETLLAMHRASYIHADLKPQNILIDPQNLEIRLIDLGLSNKMVQEGVYTFGGSPDYLAPELMKKGALANFETDAYALGATLFTLRYNEKYVKDTSGFAPSYVYGGPLELEKQRSWYQNRTGNSSLDKIDECLLGLLSPEPKVRSSLETAKEQLTAASSLA